MPTSFETNCNHLKSNEVIVPFFLQNQQHLTKSKAWPQFPDNPKHYKTKNMAWGVLQNDPENVPLQNQKPAWRWFKISDKKCFVPNVNVLDLVGDFLDVLFFKL